MKKKTKNKLSAIVLAGALTLGGVSTAYAGSFGNHLNGASTKEVLQVKYNGAAWNYRGSGYKSAWFKYTRNGKTLLYRYVKNGKVTGSVWDNLVDWSKKQTTRFYWGHQRR